MIEADHGTFALDLHRDLTVVAGVDRRGRNHLIHELIGSLGVGRPGLHVEVTADNGTRFAVRRPHGEPTHAVDTGADRDVSGRFADGDGRVDLLAVAGLDESTTAKTTRLNAEDLTDGTRHEQLIRRLALLDPSELWSAAERVRAAERGLGVLNPEPVVTLEEVTAVTRVEERQRRFEAAQGRAEWARKLSFVAGAVSALAVVPTAIYLGRTPAMLWLIVAATVTALSVILNQRVLTARGDADEALADAGLRSYSSLQLQRIDGLLDNGRAHRRMVRARAERDEATRDWTALVGGVDTTWALDHRDEIREAAESLTELGATTDVGPDDPSAICAHAVLTRLRACRTLGPDGESLPLLLDDPFATIDADHRPALLRTLLRLAADHQIVILTDDDDIATWARAEAAHGTMSLVEPDLSAMVGTATTATTPPEPGD